MADLSLADIKAAMGDGEGNGLIWLLAIIMLMGGGNWGNRYEPQYATEALIQNERMVDRIVRTFSASDLRRARRSKTLHSDGDGIESESLRMGEDVC